MCFEAVVFNRGFILLSKTLESTVAIFYLFQLCYIYISQPSFVLTSKGLLAVSAKKSN